MPVYIEIIVINESRILCFHVTPSLKLPIFPSSFVRDNTLLKLNDLQRCKGNLCTLLMIFNARQRSSLNAPLAPRIKPLTGGRGWL